MALLWVKTFHILFMASWFAGLFLPAPNLRQSRSGH